MSKDLKWKSKEEYIHFIEEEMLEALDKNRRLILWSDILFMILMLSVFALIIVVARGW